MKRNILVILLCITLLICSAQATFALEQSNGENEINEFGLSKSSITFLRDHQIDITTLINKYGSMINNDADAEAGVREAFLYEESVQSLIRETEAYGFTDEQIRQYMIGVVSTPTTVIIPNKNQTNIDVYVDPFGGGLGYQVETNAGYYQSTAFATLPTVSKTNTTSQYMFYSLHRNNALWSPVNSSCWWTIDGGLWYGGADPSNGNIDRWRCIFNPGNSPYEYIEKPLISTLSFGSEVYFNVIYQNDGYFRVRVVDANDFSIVYGDGLRYIDWNNGFVQSNVYLIRQITLCSSTNAFSDNSYCDDAAFYMAYVYDANGYYLVQSSVANSTNCGVLVPINYEYLEPQVIVDSTNTAQWYQEKVDIHFY